MMAMSEEREGADRTAPLKTMALSVLLGLVAVIALGAAAGATAVLVSDPEARLRSLAIASIAVVIGGLAVWGIVRLKPWPQSDEPISPKTRRANNLLLISGLIGGVLGAALSLSTVSMDDPWALFSNGPLPQWAVIPALAVWLLIVPVISWQWHRSIDEHEAEAYKFGGIAALYLYAFLTPAWWFAWRGGLVPAPQTMVIYMLVISVFAIGWFWRRSR